MDKIQPKRYLEIGAYEGQSTTFVLEQMCKYHLNPSAVVIDPFVECENGVYQKNKQLESQFKLNLDICLERLEPKKPELMLIVD